MKFLTKKKFKAWLESKAPKTKVGYKCDVGNCPLAKFITQTTGLQCDVDSEVVTLYYADGWESREYKAPEWVRKFVELVDVGLSWSPSSVNSKKALSILKQCA